MMPSIRRAALAALPLALAFAGALHAVGEGRVDLYRDGRGRRADRGGEGRPRPAGSGYRLEKVSDAKGQFMLLVLDATQEYQLAHREGGVRRLRRAGEAEAQDTIRLTFALPKAARHAAAAPRRPPRRPRSCSGADQAILAYNEGVTALRGGNDGGGRAQPREGGDARTPAWPRRRGRSPTSTWSSSATATRWRPPTATWP